MQYRLWILVIAFVPSMPAPASASICFGREGTFTPSSGAELPENPRLFLFLDPGKDVGRLEVTTESAPLPYTLTALASPSSSRAYQIDIVAPAGTSFAVRALDDGSKPLTATAEYAVARLAPSTRAPITIRSIESQVWSGCYSNEKSQHVRISGQAPAYRIEWAEDAESFASGQRRSIVLPAELHDHDPDDSVLLRLGWANCVGTTFEWNGNTPVHARFTALHVDGSEQAVASDNGALVLGPPRRSWWRVFTEDLLQPVVWYVLGGLFYFWP